MLNVDNFVATENLKAELVLMLVPEELGELVL